MKGPEDVTEETITFLKFWWTDQQNYRRNIGSIASQKLLVPSIRRLHMNLQMLE